MRTFSVTGPASSSGRGLSQGCLARHQQQHHLGSDHARARVRNRSTALGASAKSALILEVDGALVDIHDGHRTAFNRAFSDLGLDCVSWTPPVYNDLLSSGDGSAEGLITAYFSAVGWPLSTPTNERHIFAAKVHQIKRKAFDKMVKTGGLPIRASAQEVIADALQSGAVVAFIAGTRSEDGAGVASSVLGQLEPALAAQVRVFTAAMLQGSMADGEQAPPTLAAMLSQAQSEEKRRLAATFLGAAPGAAVGLSVGLQTEGTRQLVSVESLAAIGAMLDVPLARCLLLGGQNSTLQAAGDAGMVPVAMPRRLAMGGTYPSARAKFEGFGVGLATWARLRAMLEPAA